MSQNERLNILIPNRSPLFTSHYTVGFQELNFGNHLSNDKYMVLAEETYLRYVRSMGFNGAYYFGSETIIVSAQIQFLSGAVYGDDITMNFWLTKQLSKGFQALVQLVCDDREIGRIQFDRLFFDNTNRTVLPSPPEFLEYYQHHDDA